MKNPSTARLSLANKVAVAYTTNSNVVAVLVGGSTARGYADRYSDIEMGMFWSEPPSDEDRARAVERTGGDLIQLYLFDPDENSWQDDFIIGRAATDQPHSGILVEVIHHTVTAIENVLDEVLLEFNTDPLKHNLIADVWDSIPLHGGDIIAEWKNRVGNYPDELAVAMVRKYAQIDHFWRWQMWLSRGQNLMMLYDQFGQIEFKLLHVLLALNHQYFVGFKWLEQVISRMEIAPHDLANRLRSVYQVPSDEAAAQLAGLVEEVYDLVELHLPSIDVGRLRQVFRYQRPTWEDIPPG